VDWRLSIISRRGEACVGFIVEHPKGNKSWLSLDMAVAVASGTPCLGRFPVPRPGPVLVYAAEDHLDTVRTRLVGLCAGRVDIGGLGRARSTEETTPPPSAWI